jgi:hypothetical protein
MNPLCPLVLAAVVLMVPFGATALAGTVLPQATASAPSQTSPAKPDPQPPQKPDPSQGQKPE